MPKTAMPGEKIGTNLYASQEGNILSFHVDVSAAPFTSKNGKTLLATSHGPITTRGVRVGLNVTPVGA